MTYLNNIIFIILTQRLGVSFFRGRGKTQWHFLYAVYRIFALFIEPRRPVNYLLLYRMRDEYIDTDVAIK